MKPKRMKGDIGLPVDYKIAFYLNNFGIRHVRVVPEVGHMKNASQKKKVNIDMKFRLFMAALNSYPKSKDSAIKCHPSHMILCSNE